MVEITEKLIETPDSRKVLVEVAEVILAKLGRCIALRLEQLRYCRGAVAGLVGIRVGVVSGVINLELSGVEASDWRLRHDQAYHEA